MMSCLRVKLGHNREFSSESRPSLLGNPTNNTKMAQLVHEKIDNKLKKAYQKLRLDGCSRQKENQPPQFIESSIVQNKRTDKDKASRGNINHICLKRRTNLSATGNYFTPLIKQSKRILEKDDITLVDNRDVMEYIQLVYDTYNIKDPLYSQKKIETASSVNTIQKNRKDALQLDEQYSLDSARTAKENAENIAEISQFDVEHQGQMKKTANKKHNKIVITLRSNSGHKHGLKQVKQTKNNPLFASKEKSNNQKAKKGSIQHLNKEKTNSKQDASFVPVYRYCFACEKPIFQQNIRKHQTQCIQLQLAYKLKFSQIIKVLDEKIQRIISQIENNIVKVSTDSLSKRFEHLQGLIKIWVTQVFEIKTIKHSYQQSINETFRNQFEVIKQALDDGFYDKFQFLNKLNWFTKLRQNIMKKSALL